MTFKNASAKAITFFAAISFTACGVSIRDISEPGWEAKQDKREAEQKINELKNNPPPFPALKSPGFDLTSEKAACDKAKEIAENLKVTLVSCALENEKLILEASSGDVTLTQPLDYRASLVEFSEQMREVQPHALKTFFFSMCAMIDLSRR